MLDRLLEHELRRSKKSILLLGPRQTGKSTLLRLLRPDLTINLALESTYLQFSSNPGELEQRVGERKPQTVFIDEIQRLPSLLNTAQALLDDARFEGKQLRFFFTGSSARKLKRGKANLLPGRVLVFELGPLIATELGYAVNTLKALSLGLLPEPYLGSSASEAKHILRSYSGSYLKEEIQAEALTQNLEGFSRFLMAAAENAGHFLDFSKLAKTARVSRTSTVRFFEILEDTLIATRCIPYPDAKDADLTKHPRYFFFDTGVLNGLLGNFVPSADRAGLLFEHLLFNQIRVAAKTRGLECSIYNFRTRGGLEIDFIVTLDDAIWAIEAKSGSFDARAANSIFEQAKRYLPKKTQAVIATAQDSPAKKLAHSRVLPWQRLIEEMGL